MTRRRLVALVSACVLLVIGLVALSTVLFVTHTQRGRDVVRDFVAQKAAAVLKKGGGKAYIGHISGSFIGGVTIDSLELRDKRGEIFLATGPVSWEWNWRDIVDNRIYLYRVHVEHPYIHIIQHADGSWNFKEILASSNQPAKPKSANERNLGDYIVMDSVSAKNTTFLLSLAWEPDDTLRGAVRDSVIRYHLNTPAKAVTRSFDGYRRLYAWRNGSGLISHIRLADPDSDKFGQEFKIAALNVDEYEPTFKFRNVRATVRRLGDSVFFDVPHFDMPASVGHTPRTGKVWWGRDLPVRYDVAIRGDSVSLDDVNWVYPTLPRTGGGTLDLVIRNESYTDLAGLRIVDFRLQKMDVRSTGSHLTGEMWFGVGAPILLVRNVNLDAEPVTFDLLRTINGKPFPEDWRGNITGAVRARGGPLTHFYVDDARATFSDAHVRGAVSRGHGRGELDILYPALTAFHNFAVDDASIDLRTIEYLFPSFPRLAGVVSGRATLDSSWLDVRFSNADLYHRDGPGDPSHVMGSGRVTYGEKYETYDLTLDADPLNLTMVGKSLFPSLPSLGLVSGPLRVRGQTPDLEVVTSLQGASGSLSFDGRVDADSIGGYGAHGRGQFSGVDFGKLLAQAGAVPAGTLSGHYEIDLAGESAASLRGLAEVSLERTSVNGVRVYPTHAQVRFGEGRIRLADTLRVHTDAGTVVASGGVGLPKGRPDTLTFSVSVDSLGGLRPIISHPDTTLLGAAATRPDSLSGDIKAKGTLVGTLDALDLRTQVTGSELYWNKDRGQRLTLNLTVRDLLNQRIGNVEAHVDSVTLFGIALDTLGGRANLIDSTHATFSVGALSRTGPTATVGGVWSRAGALSTYRLDSAKLNLDQSRWRLAAPATIALDTTGGWRVDSLVLRNADTAVIALAANVPRSGAAFARLRAQGIPLADVRTLTQISDSLSGVLNVGITATGTKTRPNIQATALVSSIRWAGLAVDSVSAHGNYANGRALLDASLVRDGRPTANARGSVPVDISLLGFKKRNDSLHVTAQAAPTDLSILRPLVGNKIKLSGQLAGGIEISGRTTAPIYNGNISLRDATATIDPLGVTFTAINGTLTGGVNEANQDSLNVRLSARTVNGRSVGKVSLVGWARDLDPRKRRTAFNFALVADSLHALSKRTVADLTISTRDVGDRLDTLRLAGTFADPVLSGPLTIDRGAFFLMDRDLARKQGVSGSLEFIQDTAATAITFGSSAYMTELENNLRIAGVPIHLGRDVRLRSTEANVLLSGDLTLTKSNSLAARGEQIEGTLLTVSGTYNLKLGLVQREFSVLPGGTVTFDGPPTTPRLNIRAQYNVPQYKDRPLGVIVILSDRMPNPRLSFTSTSLYEISQSDLLSYLLTGRPGFALAGQQPGGADLLSLVSPTVGVWASEGLRRALPFFDVLQLQLGAGGAGTNTDVATSGVFSRQNLQSYITAATVDLGRQLTDKLFVAGTVNFCQLTAASNYGARLEYRFQPTVTLQASYDPPPLAGTCGQQIVSLVQQPSQGSFSLLHTWRF